MGLTTDADDVSGFWLTASTDRPERCTRIAAGPMDVSWMGTTRRSPGWVVAGAHSSRSFAPHHARCVRDGEAVALHSAGATGPTTRGTSRLTTQRRREFERQRHGGQVARCRVHEPPSRGPPGPGRFPGAAPRSPRERRWPRRSHRTLRPPGGPGGHRGQAIRAAAATRRSRWPPGAARWTPTD
jgi:hypothetical protein